MQPAGWSVPLTRLVIPACNVSLEQGASAILASQSDSFQRCAPYSILVHAMLQPQHLQFARILAEVTDEELKKASSVDCSARQKVLPVTTSS